MVLDSNTNDRVRRGIAVGDGANASVALGSVASQQRVGQQPELPRPFWIALVTPGWPSYRRPNGIVTYTHHMKSGLERLGIKVFIIAHAGGADNKDASSDGVFYVDGKKLNTSLIGRSLDFIRFRMAHENAVRDYSGNRIADIANALAMRHGYGIIELEESFGLAATIRRYTEIPILTRLHGPWVAVGPNSGARKDRTFHRRVSWEREGILASDYVVAPNETLRAMMTTEMYIRHPNVNIVPNPIAIPDQDQLWTQDNSEAGNILFVGRLDHCKGVDIILEAFDLLAREDPEVRLTLVGPDVGFRMEDNRDERLPELLHRCIGSSDTLSRIDVKGGLGQAEITRLRLQAAVSVVPSRFEAFGYTVVESMAQRCPTIGADVAGISEIIEHEKTGLLFHPDDPAHVAETLRRVLDNPVEASAFAEAGYLEVRERYNIERVSRQQLDVYDNLFRSQSHGLI